MAEVSEKERVNPYRLNLVPGKEGRRPEWNLIVVSDVPVTVNFFHTDMLEKVIAITGVKEVEQREEAEVEG